MICSVIIFILMRFRSCTLRAFSDRCVLDENVQCSSLDGRLERIQMYAFSGVDGAFKYRIMDLTDFFLGCFREQVFIKTMFPLCGLRGDFRRGAWVQMWRMPAWVLRGWNQM